MSQLIFDSKKSNVVKIRAFSLASEVRRFSTACRRPRAFPSLRERRLFSLHGDFIHYHIVCLVERDRAVVNTSPKYPKRPLRSSPRQRRATRSQLTCAYILASRVHTYILKNPGMGRRCTYIHHGLADVPIHTSGRDHNPGRKPAMV